MSMKKGKMGGNVGSSMSMSQAKSFNGNKPTSGAISEGSSKKSESSSKGFMQKGKKK